MTRSIFVFICLLLTVFLPAVFTEAQPPKKIPRIGVLFSASPSTYAIRDGEIRRGLRELGYVEGQSIAIKYMYGEGKLDRLPDLAAELIRLNVDIIAAGGNIAIRAVKKVTSTIRIVMLFSSDPIAAGLVASLGHPGGNITGLSLLAPELSGKQLELLKETIPQLSRVAVLGDPRGPTYGTRLKEIEFAAQVLGLQIQPVELRGPDHLTGAFSAITKERAGAVIGIQSPVFGPLRERIANLAIRSRLPTIYIDREFAEAGGLMSYGPHQGDLFRRAATYVDKILKGTKPVDLPVEQPTKFEFVINVKTAKQIGLTIPPNVLARADRVIR